MKNYDEIYGVIRLIKEFILQMNCLKYIIVYLSLALVRICRQICFI